MYLFAVDAVVAPGTGPLALVPPEALGAPAGARDGVALGVPRAMALVGAAEAPTTLLAR